MRPTYQVVYLPEAEAALEKTATYITEHDGPQRAANWLLRMIESIDKLETMPSIFAERGVRAGWKIRAKLEGLLEGLHEAITGRRSAAS